MDLSAAHFNRTQNTQEDMGQFRLVEMASAPSLPVHVVLDVAKKAGLPVTST